MDWDKIEILLKKYENAATTLAEEQLLKSIFKNEDVPIHLQSYEILFNTFTASKNESFKSKLKVNNNALNWRYLSIAASILVLFSVSIGYQQYEKKQKAKAAFAETKKALDMLSQNMNKGNLAFVQLKEYQYTTDKIFNSPNK
ncbi:MAG TPA: hypothetical protein VFY09_01300 [Flavobacteriaceae bacterium]|nr:hypothetical protein [Flavobacteriaceae bacterium]